MSLFRRVYAIKPLRPVLFVLLMGAVLALAYGASYLVGSPDVAKVGQCIIEAPASVMRTTDCDDDQAHWQIIGRVESHDVPAEEACAAYPETTTWLERKGRSEDFVLCLTENQR